MGKALIFEGITISNPLQTVTFFETNEETYTIGDLFTTLSSVQFSALDSLISALKTAGTWSKLRYLMIPALASTVAEAAQNVLKPDGGVPNSSLLSTLSFTNNKLKALSRTNLISCIGNQLISPAGSFDYEQDCNLSFGWHIGVAQTSNTFMRIGGYRSYVSDKVSSLQVFYTENDDTEGFYSLINRVTNEISATAYITQDNYFNAKLYNNDNKSYFEVTSTNYPTVNGYRPTNEFSLSSAYDGNGIDMFWIGTAMTKEELSATYDAFHAFADALNLL